MNAALTGPSASATVVRHLKATLLILMVTASFLSGKTWGFERDKSDVVTLRNGNYVSGDIISLRYGILTLKTDSMSTLNIEWPAVRSLSSRFAFAVERSGGLIFYGAIKTTEDGTALVVGTGDNAATIPIAEVERIAQYSPSFWQRLNGNVAIGFSYTKSSEISVGSLNLDSNYRSTTVDASLAFAFNSTKSPAEGVTDRYALSTSVMSVRHSPNTWGMVAYLERDQALGIDARLVGGPVVGRHFLQTPYGEVTGTVGVVANGEWTQNSQATTS